ncbi:hypothetical protein ABPG73_007808 [Tetrahymena malaccensis]
MIEIRNQKNFTVIPTKKTPSQRKSDLEEKLETNQKNQKNDQIFQNQGQQSYQVYPNLNAQNMIQQKPSPNLISNNNAQELINKPQVNNQSQGKIQQQQNSLQQPQQCDVKVSMRSNYFLNTFIVKLACNLF